MMEAEGERSDDERATRADCEALQSLQTEKRTIEDQDKRRANMDITARYCRQYLIQ
jgi:hypothetical protein